MLGITSAGVFTETAAILRLSSSTLRLPFFRSCPCQNNHVPPCIAIGAATWPVKHLAGTASHCLIDSRCQAGFSDELELYGMVPTIWAPDAAHRTLYPNRSEPTDYSNL